MSWLFTSGGQSIGASASVLPMNIQGAFPSGLTDLISLQSKGLSRSSPEPQFESISSSMLNLLYSPTLKSVHDCWKTQTLTVRTFVSEVMSLHGDVDPTQIQSLAVNIWLGSALKTHSDAGHTWLTLQSVLVPARIRVSSCRPFVYGVVKTASAPSLFCPNKAAFPVTH